MPVRRDLGSVDAPKAHHEWRSLGAWVASHRRKVAALDDRRPLQIAEVHNFGRCGAVFFLLAINRPKLCTSAIRSEEHTSELQSHLNLVCRLLLEKKKPR